MLKVLGFLLAIYVMHGLMTGMTYAKSGAWGRTVAHRSDPSYRSAVGSYTALTLMLLFWFQR